jgi:hypothetical protein
LALLPGSPAIQAGTTVRGVTTDQRGQPLDSPPDIGAFQTQSPALTVPTITWSQPAGISYGTPLSSVQLDTTASVPGTFVYSPGPATVLNPGSNILSVTFIPTDTTTYRTVPAAVTIDVAQATPTINWATPASIVAGTPLSSAQLDATASVPGTFQYSPAAGTIAGPGTDRLMVTFTPSDATDYEIVSATVELTVLPTSSPSPTPAVITGHQPVFRRKTNKKGKPPGKAVLSGFTLEFGTPLNPSAAANAANYQVDTVTIKKVKNSVLHILHSTTHFTVSYSPASDAVTIAFGSPRTFANGGQIAVLGGVTSASGGALSGTTVFTIPPGGLSQGRRTTH